MQLKGYFQYLLRTLGLLLRYRKYTIRIMKDYDKKRNILSGSSQIKWENKLDKIFKISRNWL